MSKSTTLEEYIAKNPYRFIGWYTDETTQVFLTTLDGVIDDWMSMITNRQKIDPDQVADMNRLLGGKQSLEALKSKVNTIYEQLTTRPDPEDDEDGEDYP